MKKTCYNCKALEYSPYLYCSLGFKIDDNGVPLEKCSKPTTIKQYIEDCKTYGEKL